MKVGEALTNVQRVFLDSAPLIYFVERSPEMSIKCVISSNL